MRFSKTDSLFLLNSTDIPLFSARSVHFHSGSVILSVANITFAPPVDLALYIRASAHDASLSIVSPSDGAHAMPILAPTNNSVEFQ